MTSRERPLIKSFNYAVEGIVYVLRTQRNMRLHFVIAVIVLLTALFIDLERWEFLILFLSIAFVMVAELLNTAIEATIDVVTTTYDPLAKIAKDVAASAVLVAGVNALIVGYLIFFRKLNPFTLFFLEKVRGSSLHVTAIVLVVVVLLVIVGKAWVREGTFLSGGWPSGHTALAFAMFAAISFLTGDAFVTTLGFMMALLVFHSRIETGIHSVAQAIAGALLGTVVTVLIFQLFFLAN